MDSLMTRFCRHAVLLTAASVLTLSLYAQQQTPSPGTANSAPSPASAASPGGTANPTAASPAPASPVPASPAQALPESPDAQAHPAPQPTGPTIVLDTSMGRMTCRLFSREAPIASANFVGLAAGTADWSDPVTHQKMHGKPLYDGTTFHRVIPGFMIQGGDPEGNGQGDPGYLFKDEVDPSLNFDVPGRLAMANSGPDTNGSQFFVTEAPDDDLDQKYTIFGQCDSHSVLVVQSIARVERDSHDKPLDPVVLRKVTVVPDGQPIPPPPAASEAPAAQPQP
jgi:peptidyl-prolyl cis-trans isomerase A (cyclophilin A)